VKEQVAPVPGSDSTQMRPLALHDPFVSRQPEPGSWRPSAPVKLLEYHTDPLRRLRVNPTAIVLRRGSLRVRNPDYNAALLQVVDCELIDF
jgi:hypothetical protein